MRCVEAAGREAITAFKLALKKSMLPNLIWSYESWTFFIVEALCKVFWARLPPDQGLCDCRPALNVFVFWGPIVRGAPHHDLKRVPRYRLPRPS